MDGPNITLFAKKKIDTRITTKRMKEIMINDSK